MPTLDSGGLGETFDFPATQLQAVTDRITNQSVLANLSPEKPTLYGDVEAVTMSRKPRAQIVAEGAQKASDGAAWQSVTASPIKFQTTVRMTDEVRWLDGDHRLGIVDSLTDAIADSIARAVDLIGLHGVNPITGQVASSVPNHISKTGNRLVASSDPTADVEQAVGAIMGTGDYLPNGLALDGGYGFSLATQRYDDGRRMYPEMGFGTGVSSFAGLPTVTSNVVSGRPEVAKQTGIRSFVGDWTQVMWGFQRRIPVELIEYGDPDNGGDLKNTNEIAYRAEGVIYVAIFDLSAFATISATTPAITEPEGGSTVDPVHDVRGTGTPGSTVTLWADEGSDGGWHSTHHSVTDRVTGNFAFTGDTPAKAGALSWRVVDSLGMQSDEVDVTVSGGVQTQSARKAK